MKKYGYIVSALLLASALVIIALMSGCASQEAYTGYLDTHKVSSAGYYDAASKPLVDITLPSPTGEPYHIVVNREIKPLAPEQIKDSEWTGPLNSLIRTTGMVGGIWAAGDALGKVTENAGARYTNSQNTTRDTLTNDGDGTLSHVGDVPTTATTTTTETTSEATSTSVEE